MHALSANIHAIELNINGKPMEKMTVHFQTR